MFTSAFHNPPLGPTIESLEGRMFLAAGDLVSSFGTGGVASPDLVASYDAKPVDAAVDAGGRLLVLGSASSGPWGPRFSLACFQANGHLDPTFGRDGQVSNTLIMGAQHLALAPDGKIVVAGFNGVFVSIARFNPDGSLDTAFGNQGLVTGLGSSASPRNLAMDVQADGAVVVALTLNATALAIGRILPDGQFDPGFAVYGWTQQAGWSAVTDVETQPDGKVLVAGNRSDSTGFALARYNSNGSPDAAFGTGGIASSDFGAAASPDDVLVLPDGRIKVAGMTGQHVGPFGTQLGLAQFTAEGQPDVSFGGNGQVATSSVNDAHGAQFLADGSVLVSGLNVASQTALAHYSASGTFDVNFGQSGMAAIGSAQPLVYVGHPDGGISVAGNVGSNTYEITHLLANGTFDSAFGNGGQMTMTVEAPVEASMAQAVASPGNRTVSLAWFWGEPALIRQDVNGALDPSFGYKGVISGLDRAEQIATDKYGRVLVADALSVGRIEVRRYKPDGSLDTSFGTGGTATIAFAAGASDQMPAATAITVQRDGKILVAACRRGNMMLARLDANGLPDRKFATKGKAVFKTTGQVTIDQILMQKDGKILALQRVGNKAVVLRLNGNGRVDSEFAREGRLYFRDRAAIWSMALGPDGRILLSFPSTIQGRLGATVLAFDNCGQPDESFGKAGRASYLPNLVNAGGFTPASLVVQPDGRIVLSGWTTGAIKTAARLTVVRFEASGQLDRRFGKLGKTVTPVIGNPQRPTLDSVLQSKWDILVAGADSTGQPVLVKLQGR